MSIRLLFDENVSPRLVSALADLYPGSLHVFDAYLESKRDSWIWDYARANNLVVTKDRDFREFSLDVGAPPKVVWLGLGNCTTRLIADVLRREAIRIAEFVADPESAVLILGPGK